MARKRRHQKHSRSAADVVIFEYNCNIIVMQLQYYCSDVHCKKNAFVKHELAFVRGGKRRHQNILAPPLLFHILQLLLLRSMFKLITSLKLLLNKFIHSATSFCILILSNVFILIVMDSVKTFASRNFFI